MINTSAIIGINFSLTTEEANTEKSNFKIKSAELFSGDTPYQGGVYDLHLGTTSNNFTCETCKKTKKLCSGHAGNYELKHGVQNPLTISQTRKWLKVICMKCGANMVEPNLSLSPHERLKVAANLKESNCPSCNYMHPKILKDNNDYMTIRVHLANTSYKLYPHEIKQIFNRISDHTVELFGANIHPKNYILKNIIIPPTTIRPLIKCANSTSLHDINFILQRIIRLDSELPDVLEGIVIEEGSNLDLKLQGLNEYYYNFIKGSSATSQSNKKSNILGNNRVIKSILQRLPKKNGRFRYNLLGKRIFKIGRTTISGNPKLKIDEIGIPLLFAKILTVEETVHEYNKTELTKLFLNGADVYPGCQYIVKKNTGNSHDVRNIKRDFELEIGDIVFRHARNGDWIIINRQPTLMKPSVLTFKVKVFEDVNVFTIQLNVITCNWFNADFDGDEMNLSVLHTIPAKVEAEYIMYGGLYFNSEQTSTPMIGQTQDSLVGTYLLSKNNIKMDRYHAIGLFNSDDITPNMFTQELYTGKEVISLLLKKTPINIEIKPTSFNDNYAPFIDYDENDIYVKIIRGELISGVLDKATIGQGSINSIYHIIERKYDIKTALNVVYSMQQMSLRFLNNNGLSVSTYDMILPIEAKKQIRSIISDMILESQQITSDLDNGKIIPSIGMTLLEYYEKLQLNALRTPDDVISVILMYINKNNNGLLDMIISGSKGKIPNLVNITSIIGQNTINGKRIEETFDLGRASPYFRKYDRMNPEARGFNKHSYIDGGNVPSYIFNAMVGRFDLISKALSTSITGEQNRKMVKNNEGIIIDHMRHCNMYDRIILFVYGADNYDSRYLEKVKIPSIMLSDDEMKKRYLFQDSNGEEFKNEFTQIMNDRDYYRKNTLIIENLTKAFPFTDYQKLPVNIKRIINDIIYDYGKLSKKISIKELIELIKIVDEFCVELPKLSIGTAYDPPPVYHVKTVFLLIMSIRIELCSNVIYNNLNKNYLSIILNKIRLAYTNAIIDYGNPVGISSAEYFGERQTQYMLDSHHRSVSGGTSKSGVQKIGNILSAKFVADSSMTIWPPEEYENNLVYVQQAANNIEMMTFKTFSEYKIFFEGYKNIIHPKYKVENENIIEKFEKRHPLIRPPKNLLHWCIRYKVNKLELVLKSMEFETIIRKLQSMYPKLFIVHSSEVDKKLIVRIYIQADMKGIKNNKESIEDLANIISKTNIRGITGVIRAEVNKFVKHKLQDDGSMKLVNSYAITTMGTNLEEVIDNKLIDPTRCLSDSVMDTYKMYGIVAARQRIKYELSVGLGDDAPDERGIGIMAALMTFTGIVTSMEYASILIRTPGNILHKMAAGSPLQTLENAVNKGVYNKISGLSAALCVGSMPKYGTQSFNVYIDESKLQHIKTLSDELDEL